MTRFTVLVENTPSKNQNLAFEHGFSLLIEQDDLSILYDTGQSAASFQNALKLGINPQKITHVIISHGHYDHANGLLSWLPHLHPDVPILVGKDFFAPKYSVTDEEERYLGCNFTREDLFPHPLIELKDDLTMLNPKIALVKNFNRKITANPIPPRFCLKTPEGFTPDTFKDEIAMVLIESEGLFLISGCSHNGILNIRESCENQLHSNVTGIFGGIHLSKASDTRVIKTASELADISNLALCHCSGEAIIRQTNSLPVETGAVFILEGNKLHRKFYSP